MFSISFFFIYAYLRKRIPVAKRPNNGIQGKGNQSLPYTLKWINGMKNFECNVSKNTFSLMVDLNRHVRTHSGEKPFKCKICKKRFTQNSNLKAHLRTHTGERPYACRVCGKSFKQSSDLNRHLRLHAGETTEFVPKRQQVKHQISY